MSWLLCGLDVRGWLESIGAHDVSNRLDEPTIAPKTAREVVSPKEAPPAKLSTGGAISKRMKAEVVSNHQIFYSCCTFLSRRGVLGIGFVIAGRLAYFRTLFAVRSHYQRAASAAEAMSS